MSSTSAATRTRLRALIWDRQPSTSGHRAPTSDVCPDPATTGIGGQVQVTNDDHSNHHNSPSHTDHPQLHPIPNSTTHHSHQVANPIPARPRSPAELGAATSGVGAHGRVGDTDHTPATPASVRLHPVQTAVPIETDRQPPTIASHPDRGSYRDGSTASVRLHPVQTVVPI